MSVLMKDGAVVTVEETVVADVLCDKGQIQAVSLQNLLKQPGSLFQAINKKQFSNITK